MVVFNEGDSIIPHIDVKALVEKFKILNKMPTFFIPLSSIIDLLGHSCLVGWKMLIADETVEIDRERYFKKGLEDTICIVR